MGIENIKSTCYHEDTNTLTVTYNGGSVIEYKPIDPDAYAALIGSESIYRAIHAFTRSGVIVGTRRNEG